MSELITPNNEEVIIAKGRFFACFDDNALAFETKKVQVIPIHGDINSGAFLKGVGVEKYKNTQFFVSFPCNMKPGGPYTINYSADFNNCGVFGGWYFEDLNDNNNSMIQISFLGPAIMTVTLGVGMTRATGTFEFAGVREGNNSEDHPVKVTGEFDLDWS